MDEYIQEYISICSMMCRDPSDYTMTNVKQHNRAMRDYEKLKKKLIQDISLMINVYSVLLESDDWFVRQTAATDCLCLNICTDRAVKVLKKICRSGNRMAAMTAKRTLKVWKGEISPNEPF